MAITSTLTLPTSTPRQKIARIKYFGNDTLEVEIL